MKEARFDSGLAAPAHSGSQRQQRLRRARRASMRRLCLAGILWTAAAAGHLMLADAAAQEAPLRASARELPPPPRAAQPYFRERSQAAHMPGGASSLGLSAAREQVTRVAETRRVSPLAVDRLLAASTEPDPAGRGGEPRVCLLALNLALDLHLPAPQ